MKNLKDLGKALSKAEQRTINGGRACSSTYPCPRGYMCDTGGNNWGYCVKAISPYQV